MHPVKESLLKRRFTRATFGRKDARVFLTPRPIQDAAWTPRARRFHAASRDEFSSAFTVYFFTKSCTHTALSYRVERGNSILQVNSYRRRKSELCVCKTL